MSDDIKRNKNRLIQKHHTPYEPEYVRHNIMPIKSPPQRYNNRILESKDPVGQQVNNSTSSVMPSSTATHSNQEPSMEVDDNIYDEELNKVPVEKGYIIDNNDYVDFGFNQAPPQATQANQNTTRKTETVPPVSATPRIGDYILMVFGKIILTGNLEVIQEKVKEIVYGDEVEIDDIVVLKRVEIKIGVFLGN